MIAGDQNSDPLDGDSIPGAAQQLLDHWRVASYRTPWSRGGATESELQGGINEQHESDPRFDTADFADTAPGNLRADYVLPSHSLPILRVRRVLADAGRPPLPAHRHLRPRPARRVPQL